MISKTLLQLGLLATSFSASNDCDFDSSKNSHLALVAELLINSVADKDILDSPLVAFATHMDRVEWS